MKNFYHLNATHLTVIKTFKTLLTSQIPVFIAKQPESITTQKISYIVSLISNCNNQQLLWRILVAKESYVLETTLIKMLRQSPQFLGHKHINQKIIGYFSAIRVVASFIKSNPDIAQIITIASKSNYRTSKKKQQNQA